MEYVSKNLREREQTTYISRERMFQVKGMGHTHPEARTHQVSLGSKTRKLVDWKAMTRGENSR